MKQEDSSQQQIRQSKRGENDPNIYSNFKKQLNRKYGKMNQQQLLQKLIQVEIANKKLTNRVVDMEPFKQRKLKMPNLEKNKQLFEQFQVRKFALKICYLGNLYDGMAIQNQTQNTIQEYLFKCMYVLNIISQRYPQSHYTRAGRTDKGVSAMGNIIALNLRTKIPTSVANTQNNQDGKYQEVNYCQMLNAILPDDIRVLASQQVSQQFNARYWCKSRSYKYFFVKNNLNIEIMAKAIQDFKGKHNFINFCKMNLCNTVHFQRQIMQVELVKVDDTKGFEKGDDRNQVYYFRFKGNSFLWHQIRYMSSVLFMIGQGSQPIHIIKDLLNLQKYPKKPNYTMAPQYALILEDCEYDNLQLKPNSQTILRFYNTFHKMISRKTIEKTLITNCMMIARKDLMQNQKMSNEVFIKSALEMFKVCHRPHRKSMELHKASGKGLQAAIQSLKGKRKDLYEKKMKKQTLFQKKRDLQKQQQKKQQNKQDS